MNGLAELIRGFFPPAELLEQDAHAVMAAGAVRVASQHIVQNRPCRVHIAALLAGGREVDQGRNVVLPVFRRRTVALGSLRKARLLEQDFAAIVVSFGKVRAQFNGLVGCCQGAIVLPDLLEGRRQVAQALHIVRIQAQGGTVGRHSRLVVPHRRLDIAEVVVGDRITGIQPNRTLQRLTGPGELLQVLPGKAEIGQRLGVAGVLLNGSRDQVRSLRGAVRVDTDHAQQVERVEISRVLPQGFPVSGLGLVQQARTLQPVSGFKKRQYMFVHGPSAPCA